MTEGELEPSARTITESVGLELREGELDRPLMPLKEGVAELVGLVAKEAELRALTEGITESVGAGLRGEEAVLTLKEDAVELVGIVLGVGVIEGIAKSEGLVRTEELDILSPPKEIVTDSVKLALEETDVPGLSEEAQSPSVGLQ